MSASEEFKRKRTENLRQIKARIMLQSEQIETLQILCADMFDRLVRLEEKIKED